ncbi:histidine phosphatase family protein [Ramlibacter terrae]|uniref:Histidine phosphatase family protein n=1 Tax=Ramlibacter terrae TaxID=2732511 RepID=A0ABX6P0T8_9BURK|nr:histidine phosphatase family protein [Ramlibacter terrae]
MTTFVLLRHASHDWLGRGTAGRLPNVSLNAKGRAEAQQLEARFASFPLAAICASPQPRTQQTVQPLAASRGMPVGIEPALDEIDFGAWMGLRFEDLRGSAGWDQWVNHRGAACPPGGEPFAGVPQRARRACKGCGGPIRMGMSWWRPTATSSRPCWRAASACRSTTRSGWRSRRRRRACWRWATTGCR